jgi:hypothetical protein
MTADMHVLTATRITIANGIRAELARRRLSTNRLPTLLGKSQSYWTRRMDGTQPFDTDDLVALGSLLRMHPAELLGGHTETPPPGGGGVVTLCARQDSNLQPSDP